MVYMIYNDKLQVTVTMNDRLQDYNMFVMAQNCKIMVYDEFSDESVNVLYFTNFTHNYFCSYN